MALALTSPLTLIVRGHLLSIVLECLFIFGDDRGPDSPCGSDYAVPFTLVVGGHLLPIFLDCLFLFGHDHGTLIMRGHIFPTFQACLLLQCEASSPVTPFCFAFSL